jgi:predicted oxidoreductase
VKFQDIPLASLKVSRLAYGCMKIAGAISPPDSQKIKDVHALVEASLECGINFFDHANIYGAGRSEEVFGCVLKEKPTLRDQIVLQSKVGIRHADVERGLPPRFDFSLSNILTSVDESLKRLQTDHLDILLLHRPDILVEPEEVAAAFGVLKQKGKVKYFGVSNHSVFQIELLKKSLSVPLVVNQLQVSLLHHGLFSEGILVNQAGHPYTQASGIIDYCRLHDITIQAWSATARDFFSKPLEPNASPELSKAYGLVNDMTKQKKVDAEALLLAWLLKHPAKIQPLVGTTNPSRIRAACQSVDVELSREEWYTLLESVRGKVP